MSAASDKAYGKVGSLALGLVGLLADVRKDSHLVVCLMGPSEALDAANKQCSTCGAFCLTEKSVSCGAYYLPGGLSVGNLDLISIPDTELPYGLRNLGAPDARFYDRTWVSHFTVIHSFDTAKSNALVNYEDAQRLLIIQVVFCTKEKASGLPPYDTYILCVKRDGSKWTSYSDGSWYDFIQRRLRRNH